MAVISLKGVYRSYGKVEVLRGIDLEVGRGETIAVVGASGVGKSTLLNVMGALDKPTAGTVAYGDKPISGLDDRELARFRNRYIGFVFQFHHLLPEFTALENVMLPAMIGGAPRGEAASRAEALLREVGLGARLGHKPGELSGGEQQRTAVVRALMQSPDAVLADEPTGNLDSRTAEEVFDVMLGLNASRSTALVVVTHNERLAARMASVVTMVDGRIDGTPGARGGGAN